MCKEKQVKDLNIMYNLSQYDSGAPICRDKVFQNGGAAQEKARTLTEPE